MLRHLDDPSTIGPNMSVALVTTFYGSMLANVVFITNGSKTKKLEVNQKYWLRN